MTIEPAAAPSESATAPSVSPTAPAESATAASPYLSLRQAVRPAILAHRLLAGDQERAGMLAAECEDLLYRTGELLKAAGRARILAVVPGPRMPDESGSDRQDQLLEAYADAGLLWAKVVGSSLALAGALIERGEWEDVRALAGLLAGAGAGLGVGRPPEVRGGMAGGTGQGTGRRDRNSR